MHYLTCFLLMCRGPRLATTAPPCNPWKPLCLRPLTPATVRNRPYHRTQRLRVPTVAVGGGVLAAAVAEGLAEVVAAAATRCRPRDWSLDHRTGGSSHRRTGKRDADERHVAAHAAVQPLTLILKCACGAESVPGSFPCVQRPDPSPR
ncbi:hypothetical protein PF010_g23883 [Phytophthora fragariae]|uniref:Secreted protein n=1 Tax=Phytophthora fragariae TaxID=53985 RepID=A0A6A4CAB1_9STRA|nr:hypothetical protein PF011_g22523 [Phytophthora fragariae]KAE9076479.1 hypothetical protein PF010_g23883 [Phytophthora fragariae]KAE9233699.1 hypothetical protein PF002_g12004 [Phytophthora fragariae]KAE9234146.1 hypothetical protein PF004_g9460 [Phytophthora fragariae]KAE9283653.1 hypothetical protein PF001_g22748 [Phytophthora fragariae]